jgi:hypothetical protein
MAIADIAKMPVWPKAPYFHRGTQGPRMITNEYFEEKPCPPLVLVAPKRYLLGGYSHGMAPR